jgi:hypothetical protein
MITKQEDFIRKMIREELGNLRYKMAGYGHDEKKVNYDIVYHTTSYDNAKIILANGFNKNKPSIDEPEAIFLTPDIYGAIILTKNLSKTKNLKTDWVILKIHSKELTLYKDPYSVKESGVYTYDNIPKELISIETIIDADIVRNQNNWKSFWNWWFWSTNEKPSFIKKFNLPPFKS